MPKKLLSKGFTLIEVMVAIAVLALLIALIAELFNNATAISNLSTRHLEADARVQVLFARMASDFSRIVKRNDIDYFLKSPAHPVSSFTIPQTSDNLQAGPANDQMAFFSEVSGYSSVSSAQNTVSLVAYRINNTGTAPAMERLGTALSWGGGTAGILPVAFVPITIASNWATATLTPASSATSDPAYDANYETVVPHAFRFEYYYVLTSGAISTTPWDTTAGHTTMSGLQDVAAIGIILAVTDLKVSPLVSTAQLQSLAAQMADSTSGTVGSLQASWQATIAASALTPAVQNGIRVYERVFPIKTPFQ